MNIKASQGFKVTQKKVHKAMKYSNHMSSTYELSLSCLQIQCINYQNQF